MTDPHDSQIHDPVHRALDLLSARAWPGSYRNHAIEEFIMSGPKRSSLSRRGLWLGGALLVLCGSAVGAVVTSVVTHSFTGIMVGPDGTTYQMEGVMQIEDESSEGRKIDAAASVPDGQHPTSGTLTLDDGSVITLEADDGKPVPTEPAPK